MTGRNTSRVLTTMLQKQQGIIKQLIYGII
jgi:hypothetical protein